MLKLNASCVAIGFFLLGCQEGALNFGPRDGYCSSQNRFLSESELTDLAVLTLLANIERERQLSANASQESYIKYDGLTAFYKENPYCCSFATAPASDKEFWKGRKESYKKSGFSETYGTGVRMGSIVYRFREGEGKTYKSFSFRQSYCGKLYGLETGRIVSDNNRNIGKLLNRDRSLK